MNHNFKIGEYIIYVNGDRFEIGRIKSFSKNGENYDIEGFVISYHRAEGLVVIKNSNDDDIEEGA